MLRPCKRKLLYSSIFDCENPLLQLNSKDGDFPSRFLKVHFVDHDRRCVAVKGDLIMSTLIVSIGPSMPCAD